MQRSVCVGTGWYSDNERRNKTNSTCAAEFFDPNYLWRVWLPHVLRSIKPGAIFIYESICELPLAQQPWRVAEKVEIVKGRRSNVSRPYLLGDPHDWGASIMMGAQYAYCNEMDFVYFEQDCLCYSLDKALEWASGRNLVYGFGPLTSWQPGWAELSLIYVSYTFIPLFMRYLYDFKLHIWNRDFDRVKHAEICIHRLFRGIAEHWPFGFGRNVPIDWDQKVFYAQQMTAENLEKFKKKVL